jgi:hypothetical protein
MDDFVEQSNNENKPSNRLTSAYKDINSTFGEESQVALLKEDKKDVANIFEEEEESKEELV